MAGSSRDHSDSPVDQIPVDQRVFEIDEDDNEILAAHQMHCRRRRDGSRE